MTKIECPICDGDKVKKSPEGYFLDEPCDSCIGNE